MAYRIETVTWGPEVAPDQRADQIRTFLADYHPVGRSCRSGRRERA